MGVSDFSLITLAEAKAFLGLADTVSDRDTWLAAEIDRQSSRIETYLQRQVKARLYREDIYCKSDNCEDIYPEHTPIMEVVKLYADTDRIFGEDTLIDADDYCVNYNDIEILDADACDFRLEYVAGWGTIEIPFARQRIDLKETPSGSQLTFYLDAGRHTPAAIVEQLNRELNTQSARDYKREVSFDWRTRQFQITQTGGTLTLIAGPDPNKSALPLLGFESTLTPSPIVGETVTLDIPADLKGVALQLLHLGYNESNLGTHSSRGLRSIQIAEYRATFGSADSTSEITNFPKEIESVLDSYKRWDILGIP